jgi:hypothetical protein
VLLMLSPTILEWRRRRQPPKLENGAIAFRLPEWIGYLGLAVVGLSVLIAFSSLL